LWNGVHLFVDLSICEFFNIIYSTSARLHPLFTPANQILEPPFTNGHIDSANHSFVAAHTTFSEIAGQIFFTCDILPSPLHHPTSADMCLTMRSLLTCSK